MKFLIGTLLIAAPLLAELVSYEDAKRDVNAYIAQNKDEELFLDPYLQQELTGIGERVILDAGMWSIKSARSGATVFNIQEQERLLASIGESAVGSFAFFEGDVSTLPYHNEAFDRILSINIGSSVNFVACSPRGLEQHCMELSRVMKEGGRMLLVAPASYDQVFTDDSIDDAMTLRLIDKTLLRIGKNEDSDTIVRHLSSLEEVNRATFVRRNGMLTLVTDQSDLKHGEQIWRKEPDGIKLNYYHSEEEYLVALKNVGLLCEEIRRPCFFGNVKYRLFKESLSNDEKGLGSAYIEHNPFTIYTVVKPS